MNKRNTLVGPQLQRRSADAFRPDWKRASGFLARQENPESEEEHVIE
jgi:hypothetical protein